MLCRLSISNYALIDNIEIEFNDGLSIITGETGAGKSIILGALSLILGERVDSKVIRNAAKKSVIEASFNAGEYRELRQFFEENNFEWDDNELILRREISSNARSRAFINDSPVVLQQLRELSLKLIDIHSQHQNLLLVDEKYQLQIIDAIADNEEIRSRYRLQFKNYVALHSKLRKLKELISQGRGEEEYLRFQYDQLNKLNIRAGETAELEKQFEILNSAEEISADIYAGIYVLSENEKSSLSLLAEAKNALAHVNFTLLEDNPGDGELLLQRLESAYVEIKDIAETLEQYSSKVNANPDMLSKIESRLNQLYETQRRFKVADEAELIALKKSIEDRLTSLTDSDFDIETLEKTVKTEALKLKECATLLTESRRQASLRFSEMLVEIARPLGMNNLKFSVLLTPGKLTSDGQDYVQFLCAFNKNQDLQPIAKVASGGEISRIMLCIKTIVASKIQLPTIIFDEVDTGVSGEIADKMGEMMKRISNNIQVITITHLPQVAAKGDSHFRVFKMDTENATVTNICRLSDDERTSEIARMLSGMKVDDAAIKNAQSLLNR